MVYQIGSVVMYRTDDGAMWLIKDESTIITLTVTMNRLLSYLLARRGQVISRDEILENVWDSYGLRSSNNTLNKYVSEIRKQFVAFGLEDECIITVPRIGFMFSSDIDVQTTQDLIPVASESPVTLADVATTAIANHKKINYVYSALVIILSLAVVLTSTLIYKNTSTSGTSKNHSELKTYFLFDFKGCSVYTTQKNSAALTELKKDVFIKKIERENISCLPGTTFLYQASESYLYGKTGRIFINRCTTNNTGFISCLNYYWSGYEQEK